MGGNSTCFGVNILQKPCHIASLPVAISVSCHSSRHATAVIPADFPVYTSVSVPKKGYPYVEDDYEYFKFENITTGYPVIHTDEIEKIRSLKSGEQILLSGKIYTARDAAHKKIAELLNNNKKLPFDLNNSIIFYAGPCPANENEIIGPIGPTTSSRMDVYTPDLYKNGLLATIGKGGRSELVNETIKQTNGKYFTITGGIASLLKDCIKSAKIIAYPELGAEAVYELTVENLPVFVEI